MVDLWILIVMMIPMLETKFDEHGTVFFFHFFAAKIDLFSGREFGHFGIKSICLGSYYIFEDR